MLDKRAQGKEIGALRGADCCDHFGERSPRQALPDATGLATEDFLAPHRMSVEPSPATPLHFDGIEDGRKRASDIFTHKDRGAQPVFHALSSRQKSF